MSTINLPQIIPGYEYYKPREHLSVSSLVNFARCPRKFFYGSGVRITSPGEKPALEFGTAMHKGWPECLVGPAETRLERALAQFDTCWTGVLDDDKRNRNRAMAMFADVVVVHSGRNSIYELLPPPSGVLSIEDKVSDYEIPFAISLDGLDVPLVGRIDGWGRHRDTGDFWGIELKTSSELSARFLDSFQFNPQCLAYTLALKGMASSTQKVSGVIVEGLRVSKVNAETMLSPVYVRDHQLDAFKKWVVFVGNLIKMCEQSKVFPQYPSACSPYPMFGQPGYMCEFNQLCQVDDWTKLKMLYETRDDKVFELARAEAANATEKLVSEIIKS